MQNDEKIPNLASKLKSNNSWPPFVQKKRRKLAKYAIWNSFDSLFLPKKEGQMLPDFNAEARFRILSSFCMS